MDENKMTEEVIEKEDIVTENVIIEEPVKIEEIIYTDIVQSNGQNQTIAFHYKVINPDKTYLYASVLAPSSTASNSAIKSQFPNSTLSYQGKSTVLIQVNG